MKLNLSSGQIAVLLGWFFVYQNEVNPSEADKAMASLLLDWFKQEMGVPYVD